MSAFLASPIKAFRWKRFLVGVTAIRADVVNLFYKGYVSEEKHYTMVKGKKVDFKPNAINRFYRLEDNEI